MGSIKPDDYVRVRAELRESCPPRAFPAIPDNCWIDSTMFGLTYAPDIGRVMRAALLGCVENLEAAGISNISDFYSHIESWGLESVWKTYITRMLLFLLLKERAEDELTCPLISQWVEEFRKRTFKAGPPLSRGGITANAIPAILTSLSVDDDILIEHDDIYESSFFKGKTYVLTENPSLKGYTPQMVHLIVGMTDETLTHVVVCFLCNGILYLYDNNNGLMKFKKLRELPTDFRIRYEKVKYEGDWILSKITYIAIVGKESDSIEKDWGAPKELERKIEVDVLINRYVLYTRNVYNRIRKGEDILATMRGAPTVKRLTVDAPDVSPQQSSSRSITPYSVNEEDDQKRIRSFASCIREMAATAPYKRSELFNAPNWSAEDQNLQQLQLMSSSFRTLLETIQRLDATDKRAHGVLFKHFIFTDIRRGMFGAKAIATFLAAHGYEIALEPTKGFIRRRIPGTDTFRMESTKKQKIVLGDHEPIEGGSNRIGLLQGNPLWKTSMGVQERKHMLSIFNERPDNIHGEQIRIMILDSKFKEGIDLYDIKYVHIMEPALTESDLKQAIGRATRYCGQRGLTFVPNVGWKLDIFLYETQFGNMYPFRQQGTAKVFDAHRYMMAHSGLDLGLLEMTRNLTVLAIKSAVDYDLTYKMNNFMIQTEIRDLTELKDTIVLSVNPQTGGVVDIKPAIEIKWDKCLPRSNKFFPFTVLRIRQAFRARGIGGVSKAKRAKLCRMLEEHEEVLQDLLAGRLFRANPNMQNTSIEKTPNTSGLPTAAIPNTPGIPNAAISNASGIPGTPTSIRGLARTPSYELFPIPEKSPRLSKKELEDMPDLGDFFAIHEIAAEKDQIMRKGFKEFQEYIRTRYAEYGWAAPVVTNNCEAVPPMGQPVQFTQSQDFIRHYLTPDSPFCGLLAWHSVGTGKTCTAIATATDSFEKAGYSILWVTRNSLIGDVWKNVFGAVCSIPIQEYLKRGKKLPTNKGTRKRLLSKAWFDPISYRTLQNALVPSEKGVRKGKLTKLGELLRARHGEDPLRKTFLVIDEVHKLLDGDLKPSEYADFDKIAAAIQHSYKVSGPDSVKVLLMTATPITDNPEGLFRLLNMLIPQEEYRFPTIAEFREKYTTAEGVITPEGESFFQERAKGLISYLNREFDPSAFAQPQFHRVKVVASGADIQTDADILRECWEEEEEEICSVEDLKVDLAMALESLEEEDLSRKELAARKRTLKAEYKEQIKECRENLKTQKKRGTRIGKCISEKSKTRKLIWKYSQQKAIKKCFGKNVHGDAPRFTTVADLKRMAKKRPITPESIPSMKAVIGDM